MNRYLCVIVFFVAALALFACENNGAADEKTVGKDILSDDIAEFVYTYSNINYNAFYQRYRFFEEDGKHMFFHETRERKNDYGPTTEEDTVSSGAFELTDEQWNDFYSAICQGTVKKRNDSAESGDSGPWIYIYIKNEGLQKEYSFDSSAAETDFENLCKSLAQNEN